MIYILYVIHIILFMFSLCFNLFARTWSLHLQMVTKNIKKKTNQRGKDVEKKT